MGEISKDIYINSSISSNRIAVIENEQLVELYIDNKLTCSGRGSNVLNDPLHSVCWLANKLIDRGKFIKSGEIITTGNTLDKAIFAEPNTLVSANFEGLGTVKMQYS